MNTAESTGNCADLCPCDRICPISQALAMIGGKWKMRIICTLYVDGTQRFRELASKTAGITDAMLSSSLKDLEKDGIISRRQYETVPPKVEYTLTEHGRELWPILHRLAHWAKDEEFDGDIEITHAVQEERGYETAV